MTGPQSISPRLRAAATNPSLNKFSVPSIPSRFLTPVIDANHVESTVTSNMTDYCKMSRLIDDPAKVGPGSYETSFANRTSPRGAVGWGQQVTKERLKHAMSATSPKVGPGAYNPLKGVDKKPKSMTVGRAGLSKTSGGRLG